MKKLVALMLVLALALSCAACGSEPAQPAESNDPSEPAAASESVPEVVEEAAYEITGTKNDVWTDSIGSVWSQTIVEFTNTGSKNLFLDTCSYDLEDANGKLVKSQSMVSCYPDVLAPGEKGYLYDATILDNPVEGELTVLPHEQIEEAKVDLIRLDVSEVEMSTDNYGQLVIRGRVENTTEEEQPLVYVVAFLYDAEGSCIGQAFTIYTDPIAPGDKLGFELSALALPENVNADTIADILVYSYPTQMQF